jgi:hypothetical protein
VRKVEESGGVQRRVGGVWRQGEGQSGRDEAVEGGVEVAGEPVSMRRASERTGRRTELRH